MVFAITYAYNILVIPYTVLIGFLLKAHSIFKRFRLLSRVNASRYDCVRLQLLSVFTTAELDWLIFYITYDKETTHFLHIQYIQRKDSSPNSLRGAVQL